MLHARKDPKAVDAVIDALQRDLFIELTKKFDWKGYESYDRAYRNRREDSKIPEVYLGNEEYREVLFNDKVTVSSFFLADETREYDPDKLVFTQGISVIFQADLSKLMPHVKHRPDEEIINNIILAVKHKHWDTKLREVITGIEKVYDTLKIDYEEHYPSDMGSFFIGRFNFEAIYSVTDCKTIIIK